MIEKLREYFDEMVVYKDLKKSNFFSALSLPSFLRDWLLKKFENEDGKFDIEEVSSFIHEYLPKKDEWISIKNRIIVENERVKFLTKISVDINIKNQEITFALPDFGLTNRETIIESDVWYQCKDELVKGKETWGVVELGYRLPDEELKIPGRIKLVSFTDFCPYSVDLDYYKETRAQFNIKEWIDIILGAIDYNADGYADEHEKLTMLTRLLPFVEKRLNLIELAPKGTGKSYLFGRVSKFGWLSSGGVMSRAKMFYDISKRTPGLVCGNDFIALDEVQTISFTDVDEMRAALKGYMESGVFTVGNYEGTADSGIILLGNISKGNMDEYKSMFSELPSAFHESALIDRFHGFIKGWDIPRMHDDLKISGWALNSEYFCTIMHLLREDASYRAIVDQLIVVPDHADTRDTEAVKRITTSYLKLLFPQVRSAEDVDIREFQMYCLRPAAKMRQIIKKQLGILDIEFKGKDVPVFSVRKTSNED
ncbi:BREX system Lon protease-like protein BrxL [Desulfosporosinus lacus]|uniref:ATP-dependent Lon protease n=1 Tax=Desulfosporosinus lacus DSM 15449 TaxID=1121420 RepID=A0A1M5ZXT2_9FIRM|nr:BREX system Lon protease-like protein BrxL [Desulfosporosinus lacus]SHI29061.1 ATP-dependent Lon protease [Desulfosporosinus lacus DSM 15449]